MNGRVSLCTDEFGETISWTPLRSSEKVMTNHKFRRLYPQSRWRWDTHFRNHHPIHKGSLSQPTTWCPSPTTKLNTSSPSMVYRSHNERPTRTSGMVCTQTIINTVVKNLMVCSAVCSDCVPHEDKQSLHSSVIYYSSTKTPCRQCGSLLLWCRRFRDARQSAASVVFITGYWFSTIAWKKCRRYHGYVWHRWTAKINLIFCTES